MNVRISHGYMKNYKRHMQMYICICNVIICRICICYLVLSILADKKGYLTSVQNNSLIILVRGFKNDEKTKRTC